MFDRWRWFIDLIRMTSRCVPCATSAILGVTGLVAALLLGTRSDDTWKFFLSVPRCFDLVNTMVHCCAVYGCTNRSNKDQKSFYCIPTVIWNQGDVTRDISQRRRDRWLSNLRRESFSPSKHSRICSDHFISGKPSALYDQTNPDWAPTLLMGYHIKSSPSRYARNKQRVEKKKQIYTAEILLDLRSLFEVPACSGDIEDEYIQESSECQAEPEQLFQNRVTRSVGTQTDVDPVREELQRLMSENFQLRDELEKTKTTPQAYESDDDKVRFHSGLPSFVTLMMVFSLIEPYILESKKVYLTKFQKFMIVMMKLRMNMPLQDLAYRFGVSQTTISTTFRKVIDVMYRRLSVLIRWPGREELQKTMPMDFRRSFGVNVAVILDCFEIFIDRPSNLLARAQTWSSYKHHNTVKFLIGIAPQGCITFLSKAWGGRASDKFITEHCGILDKLLPNDIVLADRGFDIQDSVGLMCAELKIPAFTKGKKQLSPLDVEATRKIANVRIHVERVIGNVRNKYKIVNGPLPVNFLQSEPNDSPMVDKIVTVCCALTNLCDSVVPFN